MAKPPTPKVYADTVLFFNIIKREAGLWENSLKVLLAAERGDIKLVASTLLLIELCGWRGDIDESEQDQILDSYLATMDVEWVEVDHLIARNAREIAREYHLRGADATHLATAIRRKANYFMSRDGAFPYGQKISDVEVVEPMVVWQPTLDDHRVDEESLTEEK